MEVLNDLAYDDRTKQISEQDHSQEKKNFGVRVKI